MIKKKSIWNDKDLRDKNKKKTFKLKTILKKGKKYNILPVKKGGWGQTTDRDHIFC